MGRGKLEYRRKSINTEKFYDLLSRRTKLKPKTLKKVIAELAVIIGEEVRFNECLDIKNFGLFYGSQRGGRDVRRPDGRWVFLPPYIQLMFSPANDLKNYANGEIIAKDSKKNIKRGIIPKSKRYLDKYARENQMREFDIAFKDILEKKEKQDGKRQVQIDNDD